MVRSFDIDTFIKRVGKLDFVSKRTHVGIVKFSRITGTFTALKSCFNDGRKTSLVYAWEFSMGDNIFIGRDFDTYKELMNKLSIYYDLGDRKKIVVYTTDIAYDFHSFLRHSGEVKDLFAKDKMQPLKFTIDGFEFRDFVSLVGEKLITDNLYTTQIITDASQIGLNEIDILKYCASEISRRIEEEICIYKNISRLPLTNTGRARKELKPLLKDYKFRELIKSLNIEPDEMELLKKSFTGGLVVAFEEYCGKTLHNVTSFDLCSSYLASACAHRLPMGKGVKINVKTESDLSKLDKNLLWVGYAKINKLVCKYPIATISIKQCYNLKNYTLINGKIASAEDVIIPLTSVDYTALKKFYNYKSICFGTFYVYESDYLPKEYLEKVLGFYKDKTELKGTGNETLYTVKKSLLNASCFGVMVQDPLKDNVTYENGKWITTSLTLEEKTERYNNLMSRFTFYPWGIFISAFSRLHLLDTILYVITKSGFEDYVYSDTDSVKILNAYKYQNYFKSYNKWIEDRIATVCKYRNIDLKLIKPTTKKGESKPLGYWEYDGFYPVFETTGEKRYISIDEDGCFKATISGVNSKEASNYLYTLDTPFEDFSEEYFTIPKEYSGRMTVYLIKTERRGIVKDRDGEEHAYYAKTGVYEEPSSYCMTISDIIAFNSIERRNIHA